MKWLLNPHFTGQTISRDLNLVLRLHKVMSLSFIKMPTFYTFRVQKKSSDHGGVLSLDAML